MDEATQTAMMWTDSTLWSVIGFAVLGTLARRLVEQEPFDRKKLAGEAILSTLAAIALYTGGLMQGLNEVQIVFGGALAGIGSVRALEWIIKGALAVKRGS